MADLPDISETELIEIAKEKAEKLAKENAPATVALNSGGVAIGAAAFGPAGGVVGATVGSGIGYLMDKGYFDSEEEPEVIEVDIEDEI